MTKGHHVVTDTRLPSMPVPPPAPPVACKHGRWWICDERLPRGGRKILGPFESKELALGVLKRVVEKASAPATYWVDEE